MGRPQVTLPKGIAALGTDAEERLRGLVHEAHERQGQELAEALTHTMRIVPRPLRGIVRKIVGV